MTFVFVYSGGISTYRELCSIANDLNQPDLIYKFMHLANHNAMWNSRKVARAFEFYNIIRLICVNIHATDRVLYEEWVYASFSEWIPKVFLFTRTILRRKILPPICHCLDAVWNNFCIKLNVHIEYNGFDLFFPCYRGQRLGSVRLLPRLVSSSSPSCPRSSPSCTATSLTPIPEFSRPWAPSGTPWSRTTKTRWEDKNIHVKVYHTTVDFFIQ